MNVLEQKCDNCEFWATEEYWGSPHCRRGVNSNSPLDWCPLWDEMSKGNPHSLKVEQEAEK